MALSAAARQEHLNDLVGAWNTVADGRGMGEIDTLQDEKRRSVYRIHPNGSECETVIAKRAPREEAARELPFYSKILLDINLPALGLMGEYSAPDTSDSWLFIEDAGGRPYSSERPDDRVLAATWLGRLHVAGVAGGSATMALRDRGPNHFAQYVVTACRDLADHIGNPHLTRDERTRVAELRTLLDAVQVAWPSVTDLLADIPETYVHGDFKPDNLRVREAGAGPSLLVFDWNEAGFGKPALDISRFLVSLRREAGVLAESGASRWAPSIHRLGPDIDTYLAAVREVWPDASREALLRVGLVGELFHCVATIRWEVAKLAYTWVQGPVQNLWLYRQWLAWLGEEIGFKWP